MSKNTSNRRKKRPTRRKQRPERLDAFVLDPMTGETSRPYLRVAIRSDRTIAEIRILSAAEIDGEDGDGQA